MSLKFNVDVKFDEDTIVHSERNMNHAELIVLVDEFNYTVGRCWHPDMYVTITNSLGFVHDVCEFYQYLPTPYDKEM